MQALRSLATLANTSPEHNHVLLASGAAAAILQLRELNSGGAVQDAAAHALRMLSQTLCSTTLAPFVGADAIPPLARMLKSSLSSSKATLQLSATAALCNLAASGDGAGAAAVVAAGAVPPLVEVLLARAGQHIAEVDSVAARALNVIIQTGQELAWGVVQRGGLPALLALIDRRTTAGTAWRLEEQALECAALALASLAASGGESQAAMGAAGSVPRLAALLSHRSINVQGASTDALRAALHCSAAAQVAFAQAHAAPAVVCLLRSPSRDTQQDAAGVLGNAAADNTACCADILAAGAGAAAAHAWPPGAHMGSHYCTELVHHAKRGGGGSLHARKC